MIERIQGDTELFLGRADEQQRFRALLNTLLKPRGWASFLRRSASPPDWSYIVLIHRVGGIGKSTLSRRLRATTNGLPPDQRYHGKFKELWLDWELGRERDPRLAVRETVAFETILDYLYTIFRDASFGSEFDPFEAERARRTEIESRVEQALSAPPRPPIATPRSASSAPLVSLLSYAPPCLSPAPSSPRKAPLLPSKLSSKAVPVASPACARRAMTDCVAGPSQTSTTSSSCPTRRSRAPSPRASALLLAATRSSFSSTPTRSSIARTPGSGKSCASAAPASSGCSPGPAQMTGYVCGEKYFLNKAGLNCSLLIALTQRSHISLVKVCSLWSRSGRT